MLFDRELLPMVHADQLDDLGLLLWILALAKDFAAAFFFLG